MTGVTIGTGTFRPLAEKAAQTFIDMTGMPCAVLGDEHIEDRDLRFPHHLKYHMFEILDTECLFYFDSDLWWMREWDPMRILYSSGDALCAVRDLNKSGHVLKDCNSFDLNPKDYFNSGFMVLHREPHEWMLNLARSIYYKLISSPKYSASSVFKDQTSLNAAVQMMGLPVRYLDRRYNWVQSAGKWMQEGIPVIGAHKIERDLKTSSSDPKDFSKEIMNNFNNFQPKEGYKDIDPLRFESFQGLYELTISGHSRTQIELRSDGTVCSEGLEFQWWFPVLEDEGCHIIFTGHEQACWNEYMTASLMQVDTDTWDGLGHNPSRIKGSSITLRRVET